MYLENQKEVITMVDIPCREWMNTSPHDPVTAELRIPSLDTPQLVSISAEKRPDPRHARINWTKVDISRYRDLIQERVETLCGFGIDHQPPEVTIDRLCDILVTSAQECAPRQKARVAKRKGPWNSTISEFMKTSKVAFAKWKASGKKQGTAEHVAMKEARKSLRRAQRQSIADVRTRKIDDIMEANEGDQNKFYQLIRKQRTVKDKPSTHMEFNGQEVDGENLLAAWADYFEDLATPKCPSDDDYQRSVELQLLLIEHIELAEGTPFPEITAADVDNAIVKMKNNKAGDERGVTSEHLKFAGPRSSLAEVIAKVLNSIVKRKRNPDLFSSGIVHPVPKKGKDIKHPDSYRRITVTVLMGKIMERITLTTQKAILSQKQNPLQRGFTERASSANAVYILTEATMEAKDNKTPLYVTLLDASKAFDVVWHSSMLVKLYQQGVTGDVWSLTADAYKNMSSRVKWQGALSRHISEQQGIRQGGLQSTEHFKARSNPLLDVLSDSSHSYRIGIIPVGAPTCADDMTLISDSLLGMQVLLDISAEDAKQEKYSFSQKKSKVLVYNSALKPEEWRKINPLHLAETSLEVVDNQDHLGVIRSANSSIHLAKDRITLARRSMYAMMGAGMHGLNGLSPATSYRLWTTYILPRMTHTLEAVKLRKSDASELDHYQVTILKQIQHLPERTSNAAAHLLLGAVPVTAYLHRAIFTFFCNMTRVQGSVESEILRRQLSVKEAKSHSWVNTLRDITTQYQLPSAFDILERPLTKSQVKRLTRENIMEFWIKTLKREASHKITLRHLNIEACSLGKPHPVWSTLGTDSREVKKASIKVKVMVGQYSLQTAKHHSDTTCLLCGQEPETEEHFIVHCSRLERTRAGYLEKLRCILRSSFEEHDISTLMSDSRKLVKLLLDCTTIQDLEEELLIDIEGLSRSLLYSLHLERQKTLGPCKHRCPKDSVCPRCLVLDAEISQDTEEQCNRECETGKGPPSQNTYQRSYQAKSSHLFSTLYTEYTRYINT
jgi:hypothetical protein